MADCKLSLVSASTSSWCCMPVTRYSRPEESFRRLLSYKYWPVTISVSVK